MMVSKIGFGGAHLERASEDEAYAILRRCIKLGVTFFDTSTEYHSEERVGKAIAGCREGLVIATKCECRSRQYVESSLEQSLKSLGVAHIDLYQFHDVSDFDTYARATDPGGPITVLQEARKAGIVKHIGISSHSLDVAKEAVKSGLFETIMFGLNFVHYQAAEELLPLARKHDVGFIAMKPLSAGAINNITIAFKYLSQFPDIVPIPGLERLHEIDEIMQVFQEPQPMTEAERSEMLRLRAELGVNEVFYLK